MKVPSERVLWGILVFLLVLIVFAGGALAGLLFARLESGASQPLIGDLPFGPSQPAGGGEQPPGMPDSGLPESDAPGPVPPDVANQTPPDVANQTPPGVAASLGSGSNATPTSPFPQPARAPTATPTPSRTPQNSPTPRQSTPTATKTGSSPTNTPTGGDAPSATPITPTVEPPPPTAGGNPTATPELPPPPDNPIDRVNYYRVVAGVPPITADDVMNDGSLKHAMYMAAHRRLSNTEDPADPLYTDEGNRAAQRGNLWLGGGVGRWTPARPVDDWMSSPYHRLWVLYPLAERMGFGFAENPPTNATAAVLEVFGGWNPGLPFAVPLKYPAASQTGVPATRFGVSLQFPVYTPNPTFSGAAWVDQYGAAVSFKLIDPASDSYMRDYGNAIFLLPDSALSPWTTYTVRIQGTYNAQPFDIQWNFTTGG